MHSVAAVLFGFVQRLVGDIDQLFNGVLLAGQGGGAAQADGDAVAG